MTDRLYTGAEVDEYERRAEQRCQKRIDALEALLRECDDALEYAKSFLLADSQAYRRIWELQTHVRATLGDSEAIANVEPKVVTSPEAFTVCGGS